jgi:beta-galactosidase
LKRLNLSYSYLIILNFILSGFILLLHSENKNMNRSRIQFTINEQWKFTRHENDNFILKNYNDSDWSIVNLPHTWNKTDAFDENKTYFRGNSFYRKKISLNPEWKNKKIFLLFEGANQVTDLYLNGKYIGEHKGGYTAFTFDITSFLDFENENLISIRVNNSHNDDIPPLNADFTFYGGIYRDVWLIVTDLVHIDLLDYSSPGIYIDTPELSTDEAEVRIRGTIVNEKEEDTDVEVINRIFDEDNSEVTVLKSYLFIKGKSKENFQLFGRIEDPLLWTPENPYLYKVHTEIYEKGILVDEIVNPLGVRWFSFNADNGFYLNGKPLKLIGTNRHQDYEGYGNALPDQLHENDIKIIKENGFNFLRLAHYPQDPAVLQAADKYGLIVWEEIPIVNIITVSESFSENCKTMLKEMIRQHYNHPSVLMWGYMNEVMLRKPEVVPDGYYEAIITLAQELEQITKSEDNFRATAMALSYGEIENKTGIGNISDIIGMNLYFGWYYETIDAFGKYLDGYHKRNPDRPVIISEYGAGSDERIHSFNPKAFDFSTEHQQIFHEQTFPQIMERNYILGSAIWNQFDFGSNHRQDTKPFINQKGLYYFNRKPKDISYYYKAKLTSEPVIHIAVDDWKYRAGYNSESINQPLKIYNNLESITVYINEEFLGNFITENFTILEEVQFKKGKNIIRAKGEIDEKEIEETAELFFCDYNSLLAAGRGKTFAINLGADYEYIDESNAIWIPGLNIKNKELEVYGGIHTKTHHRIFNTNDDPVYQTALEGVDSLKLFLTDGLYEVELYLTEIKFKESGKRAFSIYVNDVPAFTNLDLAKDFGQYKAIVKRLKVSAINNEGVEIRFKTVTGNSLLNGIKINSIL